ncbi:MAG: phenylalanine--tRNA ligase subunit beta [Chloroflexia bacterium]|nr:phenylalanine--tRNA ligase subunit beta [Chloroflexia bacterium]
MRVPLRWLADFITIDLPPRDLAHRLTMAGLEAEKIEVIGHGWDNVYVGHVEQVASHPDADRLVLATVSAGEHRLTVVTGAPNIAPGQKVALALVGARLIDPYVEGVTYKTLKPSTIRGIRSEGMVCSEKELGLSAEHEGIMVLAEDAPVGVPLVDWLGDTVIEFEITPNLVHAFSMLGIAREAAALTEHCLHLPPVADLAGAPAADDALARLEAPELCARYLAVAIEGLRVGPSPDWLARRLTVAGVRPINNIVDVTNYVMLEWGQPLHAFDRARLAEGRIIVRRAGQDEALETLDHQQRKLTPEVLVIADPERAVGIAGVMGGVNSEVDDETTAIILESATFNMVSIRHTARALKLKTDASVRFERGLDPALAFDAAARATHLLLELCPGSKIVAVRDIYPNPVRPRPLAMPFGEIERLLGVRYQPEQVLDVLASLDLAPSLEGSTLSLTIPTYRQDLTMAADIVEEVARIVGYETLPETLPTGKSTPVQRDPVFLRQRLIREVLVASGCFEAVTYITAREQELQLLAAEDDSSGFLDPVPLADLWKLRNPMQSDRPYLRPTLLPGLLAVVSENLKHEMGVRFFELSRVYLPSRADEEAPLPHEANWAAVVLAGRREPVGRFSQEGELDFFDLKGMTEAVLNRCGVSDARFDRSNHPALHPGRAAIVSIGDQPIGVLGELRPDLAAAFGIDGPRVTVAELDLDALFAASSIAVTGVQVPRFLAVEQDFAIVVADDTPAAEVERALRAGAGPLATSVVLFDIYRGPQLGEGKKSLAYRVTFTAPDRALTDTELGKVRERIGKALKQRVEGTLRT